MNWNRLWILTLLVVCSSLIILWMGVYGSVDTFEARQVGLMTTGFLFFPSILSLAFFGVDQNISLEGRCNSLAAGLLVSFMGIGIVQASDFESLNLAKGLCTWECGSTPQNTFWFVGVLGSMTLLLLASAALFTWDHDSTGGRALAVKLLWVLTYVIFVIIASYFWLEDWHAFAEASTFADVSTLSQ